MQSYVQTQTAMLADLRESRASVNQLVKKITLYPSPHRDVIGVPASLGQQLLHIPVGKREAQIPTDGQENHLRFKLSPNGRIIF